MDHAQLEGWITGWFINAGWKPCLTELGVGEVRGMRYPCAGCWVADVVGMVHPTHSRLRRMNLMPVRVAIEEAQPVVWLAEVKVQRGDFLRDIDRKFKAEPNAHLQFLVYPRGLIGLDEIPDGWIGLEVCGKIVRKHLERAKVHTLSVGQRAEILSSIVWALWHREASSVAQEAARQATRVRLAVKHDSRQVGKIIDAVVNYLDPNERRWGPDGFRTRRPPESLEQSLRRQRIRRQPPRHVVDNVEAIKELLRNDATS